MGEEEEAVGEEEEVGRWVCQRGVHEYGEQITTGCTTNTV